jgi:REP element-mobilizing transposase RayT
MPQTQKSHLPRLPRTGYQGRAFVFWTHTFENRATGWLIDSFHARFREVLLHACARYQLACPIYVLMPDHWHLVWIGLGEASDQMLATAFLRRNLREALAPAKLQDRAHDHVLRDRERERDAFTATCRYIRENPLRAGLVRTWPEWPALGAMLAGYPVLDLRDGSFWEDFWKIYDLLAKQA